MHLNDIHRLPSIEKIRERFESFIQFEPNTGCHLWVGAVDKDGYGKFRILGCDFRAHRVGRALAGRHVDDLPLLHRCDQPGCVNGEHSFHGTQVENIADKMAKGRQAKGERQGNSTLTEQQVIEIFLSKEAQIPTAQKYGIGQAQVSSIRRGKSWAHITAPLMQTHEAVDCRKAKFRRSSQTPSSVCPMT